MLLLPHACATRGRELGRLIRKTAPVLLNFVLLIGLTPQVSADETGVQEQFGLSCADAIELVDLPSSFTPGHIGKLRVKVLNTGASHLLPAGFREGREVWIDLRLIDATGRQLYRLGAIKDGSTEPGTRNFKVHPSDHEGQELRPDVSNVSMTSSSDPALPKRQAVKEFSFAVPADAVGPITVQADLNYWPLSQKLADAALGSNKLRVEITRIASATGEVPLSRIRPTAVERMEQLLLLLTVGHAR